MHILDALKVLFWPPHWFQGGNTVKMVNNGVNYPLEMEVDEHGVQSLELTVANPVIAGLDVLSAFKFLQASIACVCRLGMLRSQWA